MSDVDAVNLSEIISLVSRIPDIRQRLIHIEDKINELLSRIAPSSDFRGSPDQRYGHLSYSQHGEDMVFIALFERMNVASPTFLDVGANHPTVCSNTALLRQRCGSRGVNVDASPDVIDIFNRERPDDVNVNVGVNSYSGTMIFYRFDATSGLNSFSKAAMEQIMYENPSVSIQDELQIPVLTLDDVVVRYCGGVYPDLLSLDAEGLDMEILKAASFVTRPKILCVETISGPINQEADVDLVLKSKGFRKLIQMYANSIYIDESVSIS